MKSNNGGMVVVEVSCVSVVLHELNVVMFVQVIMELH
jgi:hypothetical protein